MKSRKEIEKAKKDDVIHLLQKQIEMEGELVALYDKTAGDIGSSPVRHLLHMIQLDSS